MRSSRTRSQYKGYSDRIPRSRSKRRPSLQAIRTSTEVPPPNFVLDTSPGKHQVVWKISGVSQDRPSRCSAAWRANSTAIRRRLTRRAYFDCQASLTANSQKNLSFGRITKPTPYTPSVISQSKETPQRRRRHIGDARQSRTIAPGHQSQSERDWAYAKRALARGDDFEEVVRKIADFRLDDKSSPESYARRTVTKARAELDLEPFKSQ